MKKKSNPTQVPFKFDPNKSGGFIRDLRKSKSLTQEDLAVVVDLTRSQLSNIESGNSKLSIEGYFRLADFFMSHGINVEYHDLIEGKIKPKDCQKRLEEALNKNKELEEECKRKDEMLYLSLKRS